MMPIAEQVLVRQAWQRAFSANEPGGGNETAGESPAEPLTIGRVCESASLSPREKRVSPVYGIGSSGPSVVSYIAAAEALIRRDPAFRLLY